jgi:hypothetical protein
LALIVENREKCLVTRLESLDLTWDFEARLLRLFQEKEKWTFDELHPYLQLVNE